MPDHAYVAFLDILGYREMLATDLREGKQAFRDQMTEAFRVFDNINASRYNYRAISDSIFISCSDRAEYRPFLEIVRAVFVAFLGKQLLIRGGVSFGSHFQNTSVTYSPALTKAYQLESSVAEFPRIMIDANILEMFPDVRSENLVLRSGQHWFLNIVTSDTYATVWAAAESACRGARRIIETNERARIKHRLLQDLLVELAPIVGQQAPARYLPLIDQGASPPPVVLPD